MSFNHEQIEKSGSDIGLITKHLKLKMKQQSLNFMH